MNIGESVKLIDVLIFLFVCRKLKFIEDMIYLNELIYIT